MNIKETAGWLLEGDVSIQYQTYRDLLDSEQSHLQNRISKEGWGADFLSRRAQNGHWGRGFYQPKWTSTHYTLLTLKNLNISPNHPLIRESVNQVLKHHKAADGGINPAKTTAVSDVCINGMVLNYASYFRSDEDHLVSIVGFLLSQHMHDGGFNCQSNMKGAVHSSLHTTLSVIEGILEYSKNNYQYKVDQLLKTAHESREFILQHRLFRSDKTGKIIDKKMLRLSYPSYWRYDILRALDYFRSAGIAYDSRMEDALAIIIKKKKINGRWNLQSSHPGQTHFDMEKTGEASRWNTLRALRVLRHFRLLKELY